ncbi:MAG: hypothetical protein JNN02_10200 [Tabrizicola sp.]|nr:hypothetical protein [Tabrizicola sp.]
MYEKDPLNPEELKLVRQMIREYLAKKTKDGQALAEKLTAELSRQYGPLKR